MVAVALGCVEAVTLRCLLERFAVMLTTVRDLVLQTLAFHFAFFAAPFAYETCTPCQMAARTVELHYSRSFFVDADGRASAFKVFHQAFTTASTSEFQIDGVP